MGDPIAQSLLGELSDVERSLALRGLYDFDKELELLVHAILAHAGRILDVPRLDSKAQASKAIDVETLRRVVDGLDQDSVRNARLDLPGGREPLLGSADLADTKKMLEAVEEASASQHWLETAARLEFGISFPFFRLQMEIADQPAILDHLESSLSKKMALVSEADARRLWSMVTSEFQAREGRAGAPPMPADKDVLGEGFFDPSTVDDIRRRVAAYAARLKPLLVRRMLESGVDSSRSALPSAPQLLALREVQPLTTQDRRLLECLLMIYRCWGIQHEEQFIGALRIAKPHWPGRAAQLDETLFRHKKAPTEEERTKLLLLSLRRLLGFTESFVSIGSPVERILVQYKLGLEVMLPESREAISVRRELKLQKELCRFLVERDVRAFGKRFGRSEVDLLAEIPGERLLIETKVVKGANERGIERNVTQLLSYMDQEEAATRGVLVLYNIGETLIVSEMRWFRERLWILPINLCATSPSKTKKRLCIEDGETDSVLRFLASLDEPLVAQKQTPRKGRRTSR